MRSLCIAAVAVAAENQASLANPIRRVVNMLQGLQTKIEAEAKEAEHLFNKFQCYCSSNDKKLTDSISAGDESITRLESSVKSTAAEKTQTQAELKSHKEDREAAKSAIAEANEMREKEHSDFTAESGDLKANLGAMDQAIPAIEKGMAGSFLQTTVGSALGRIAEVSMQLTDGQKADLQAFLQGNSQYAPAAGQIVGILKTMKEEMEANLAEITKSENEAAQSHAGMIAAKNSEIAAATESIEEKTGRAGDLAVRLVTEENDLKETRETKEADESFLRSLRADCEKTAKDQEEAKKARATELVAIADTIKMLNSDEALELFKKTLPSPSLIQVHQSEMQLRRRALALLRRMRPSVSADLIMLALQGKKEGMDVVEKEVDKMEDGLKKEQVDDDEKVEYCKRELQKAEDDGKELQTAISTLETRMDSAKEVISDLEAGVASLTAGIKDLDKAVAEATEQRKAEHAAYLEEAANNNGALELLGMAKKRLAKAYEAALYQARPAREQFESYSFIQRRDEPEAPPPVKGHSNQDAGGVVALMANLINDLKKEMQENEFTEKDAQEDYEKLLADSKLKRAEDASARTDKEATLADAKGAFLELSGEKKDRDHEHNANKEYLSKLHTDCDWTLEEYEARKAARTEEDESLHHAKDVLHGADFSLVQTQSKPALLSEDRAQSCSAADAEHRRVLWSKIALLQGFCEDMCRAVGSHPDCRVCDGFVPPASPGALDWDGLYAQFDKLKLVGRDMIKEWTGDAGKFGR